MMIISKVDFLYRTNLDEDTLEFWLAEEWLLPQEAANDLQFSEMDVARAQLIRDLTASIGVNREGVGIILDLIDQMHSLRRAVGERLQIERRA